MQQFDRIIFCIIISFIQKYEINSKLYKLYPVLKLSEWRFGFINEKQKSASFYKIISIYFFSRRFFLKSRRILLKSRRKLMKIRRL